MRVRRCDLDGVIMVDVNCIIDGCFFKLRVVFVLLKIVKLRHISRGMVGENLRVHSVSMGTT